MSDQEIPAVLPWESPDADVQVMAAGLWRGAEVQHWQALAQRIEHAHAAGRCVLHHWVAAQPNGLAPLVLFHGGSGSWTHWVRNIGALLDAGHDVWAVDLPGFGASDPPAGAEDAADLLALLAAVLHSQFAGQPVRLLGFSFGAMTACMLAAAYPQLVQQLVMVGAPGMGLAKTKTFRLKGWRHLKEPRQQLLHHIYNLQVLMLHDQTMIDRDTVGLHVHNVQRDQLPRRRISSTDVVLQTLPRVLCPVGAIYGARDVLYADSLNQVEALLAQQTPHWQGMQCIAGAGHWVQYEQARAFHAALLPLLAKNHEQDALTAVR